MIRLIRFDLINIFKGISFYICLACLVSLTVISVGMRALADAFLYGFDFNNLSDLQQIGYSGIKFLVESPAESDYTLLIAILATIVVCMGYSDKSYRNIWARGFSREQTFISKCVAISVVAAVYAVTSMLFGFVTGTIFWGIGTLGKYTLIAIFLEILMCVGIGIMYVALAFVFKRMAVSIVIAVMTPSLLSIGSTVMDYILEYRAIDFRVSPFILTNTLSNIALAPNDKEVLASSFLCFAVYLISMVLIGLFGMRKDEI